MKLVHYSTFFVYFFKSPLRCPLEVPQKTWKCVRLSVLCVCFSRELQRPVASACECRRAERGWRGCLGRGGVWVCVRSVRPWLLTVALALEGPFTHLQQREHLLPQRYSLEPACCQVKEGLNKCLKTHSCLSGVREHPSPATGDVDVQDVC